MAESVTEKSPGDGGQLFSGTDLSHEEREKPQGEGETRRPQGEESGGQPGKERQRKEAERAKAEEERRQRNAEFQRKLEERKAQAATQWNSIVVWPHAAHAWILARIWTDFDSAMFRLRDLAPIRVKMEELIKYADRASVVLKRLKEFVFGDADAQFRVTDPLQLYSQGQLASAKVDIAHKRGSFAWVPKSNEGRTLGELIPAFDYVMCKAKEGDPRVAVPVYAAADDLLRDFDAIVQDVSKLVRTNFKSRLPGSLRKAAGVESVSVAGPVAETGPSSRPETEAVSGDGAEALPRPVRNVRARGKISAEAGA